MSAHLGEKQVIPDHIEHLDSVLRAPSGAHNLKKGISPNHDAVFHPLQDVEDAKKHDEKAIAYLNTVLKARGFKLSMNWLRKRKASSARKTGTSTTR
ncbi:hypothetical protein AMATHDRAFT_7590 [Amanita thiersii Skay4041]|uniref:Uncharacterized protein n=1 Tax=Amanita thiersii Skay4041 TaxID=703135 RepID=A0A2A9NFY0_9AGAR|nr:hypothetical protein AMATHDRAFT_7590 [Amanita thiersii Skay4041]